MRISRIVQKLATSFHLRPNPINKKSTDHESSTVKVEPHSDLSWEVIPTPSRLELSQYNYFKESSSTPALCALSGAAHVMLEGVKAVAAVNPVPGISCAISLAENIFHTCQQAHGNTEDLNMLAEQCIITVHTAKSTCHALTNNSNTILPVNLQNDIDQLCCTLREIGTFAKKRAKRGYLKRVFTSHDDSSAVKRYHAKMKHSLEMFTLRSLISLRAAPTHHVATLFEKQTSDSVDRLMSESAIMTPVDEIPRSSSKKLAPKSLDSTQTRHCSPRPRVWAHRSQFAWCFQTMFAVFMIFCLLTTVHTSS
ncbi:hypothetical protein K435DRAFT_871989 [Dendrothele bispora CBS 962.96]|uniref:Uncharacterized protein n=1 Tax=Dendrothele bispora (strain CBS 962.96) TaxID=1314807 RepID=A0A4S8L401_DENBC|nr:hypothetical protein K435DRAFT_871989 [Dendrothele bispora CBS 962.96]